MISKRFFTKVLGVLLALVFAFSLGGPAAMAATPEEIGISIQKGIDWLVSVQNANGSWGPADADRFGTTGLILVKLQDRAFELGYNGPFDDAYPLKANVVAGLNYMLPYASTTAISNQAAGNPDTNGNGLGVTVGNRVYDAGILMMALAAGRDPSRTVSGGPLAGWTYGAVLQDLADWMSYAQTDTVNGRGGWYYNAINGGSSADQSNAGYALLGLLYASAPLYGYNSNIPAFVASELNYWIDYIQSDWIPAGVNPDWDGGSGYTAPDYWVNSLKTGNLLTQMAFFGDTPVTVRVQEALNYIGRHWNDNWVQGWGKTGSVQYQATYCLMKGFETMGIALNGVPGVADWYQDMANEIIAEQNANGSWPSSPAYVRSSGSPGHMVSAELSTAWALLTLERFSPPGALTLVPPTDSNPVGTTHELWATYVVGGAPQAGILIKFEITAGPNVGVYGSAVTNANGEAYWAYTGSGGPGVDTIKATAVDASGAPLATKEAFKTWTEDGGPGPGPEVGGDVYGVNKALLLAPWLALGCAIIAGGVLMMRRRQTQS